MLQRHAWWWEKEIKNDDVVKGSRDLSEYGNGLDKDPDRWKRLAQTLHRDSRSSPILNATQQYHRFLFYPEHRGKQYTTWPPPTTLCLFEHLKLPICMLSLIFWYMVCLEKQEALFNTNHFPPGRALGWRGPFAACRVLPRCCSTPKEKESAFGIGRFHQSLSIELSM